MLRTILMVSAILAGASTIKVEAQTARIVYNWTTSGEVDSFVVNTTASPTVTGFPRRKMTRLVSDTIVATPAPTENIVFTTTIIAYRRGLRSAATTNVRTYQQSLNNLRIARLHLTPDTATVPPLGTRQFCLYVVFRDSTYAYLGLSRSIPDCVTTYNTFPPARRNVTLNQQFVADSTCAQFGVLDSVGGLIMTPCARTIVPL